MTSRGTLLDELQAVLDEHDRDSDLTASLRQARRLAEADLGAALFEVLAWPEDVTADRGYLERLAWWIPQQSDVHDLDDPPVEHLPRLPGGARCPACPW